MTSPIAIYVVLSGMRETSVPRTRVKTVVPPQSSGAVENIASKTGEVPVEINTVVSETITVTAVTATANNTPSSATDTQSSPVYALDSPVFPASVIGSPTKLHSIASSIGKTLTAAAEKLAANVNADTMAIGEDAKSSGSTVADASAAVSATVKPSGTVIIPVSVVKYLKAAANTTVTSSDTVTASDAAEKDSNATFNAASKTSDMETVSIDIVKDFNVTISMPAKMSDS